MFGSVRKVNSQRKTKSIMSICIGGSPDRNNSSADLSACLTSYVSFDELNYPASVIESDYSFKTALGSSVGLNETFLSCRSFFDKQNGTNARGVRFYVQHYESISAPENQPSTFRACKKISPGLRDRVEFFENHAKRLSIPEYMQGAREAIKEPKRTSNNIDDNLLEPLEVDRIIDYYFDKINWDGCSCSPSATSEETGESITDYVSDSGVHSDGSTRGSRDNCSVSEQLDKDFDIYAEIYNQSYILEQATKAVWMCMSQKRFHHGQERLEAERVLLLADLKRKLLLKELRQNSYDGSCDIPQKQDSRFVISDLELPLRAATPDSNKSCYLAVCSCDSRIEATELFVFPTKSDFLTFPDVFVFDDIRPDAAVTLQVFELKLEDIRGASKDVLGFFCFDKTQSPVPRKERTIQYKSAFGDAVECTVLSSIFRLQSSLTIKLQPDGVPMVESECCDRTLQGTVKVQIGDAEERFAFLSVGKELPAYVLQDQKWSHLDGSVFQFWADSNEPSVFADMGCSFERCAQDANEYILNLPRALLFEINNHGGSTNGDVSRKKYFLVSNTPKQLDLWKNRFNSLTLSFNLQKMFGNES